MNMKNVFRPIWEMELVISGAVILGLFQLPHVADQAFNTASPHLAFNTFFIHFLVYYVAKLTINTLIGSFMLHFIIRSLWVAIMGLREVFPDEVDLDKTDFAPMAKKLVQSKGVNLESLQVKLDHFASMIFSILFLLIVVMSMMTVYGGVCVGLALILPKLGVSGSFFKLFLVSFGFVYGLPTLCTVVAGILDNWFKNDEIRIHKYPRIASMTLSCMTIVHYLFFGFITQPIAVVIRSKISSLKFSFYSFVIMCFIVMSFIIGMMIDTREFDSYVYMPVKTSPFSVNTACYDSLRRKNDSSENPSIQSDVIKKNDGPVRLFLPYYVIYNNQLMEELCPDLEPLHADGWYEFSYFEDVSTEERLEKIEAAWNCAQQLYSVTLDGKPVSEEHMKFTRHHLTDKGGFLLYISTSDLKEGHHVLHIDMQRQKKKELIHEEFFIPFWLETSV